MSTSQSHHQTMEKPTKHYLQAISPTNKLYKINHKYVYLVLKQNSCPYADHQSHQSVLEDNCEQTVDCCIPPLEGSGYSPAAGWIQATPLWNSPVVRELVRAPVLPPGDFPMGMTVAFRPHSLDT